MKEFKYKTVFSSVLRPIISKEKNLQLAKASLNQLRQFIPNVDIEANYDLLPIAFPLFNVNHFNKNDDGVDTAFALQVYKTFVNKFINLDHKRGVVVGTILSASLTEFGTDKPLTEDDVKGTKDVFNVTVGGVLWRAVNENLTDLIEESNNILDDNYDKIKASFEIGFTDFNLVKCPANSRSLAEGVIIDCEEEKSQLSSKLRAFGGTGKLDDGSRIYRLLSGEGIGLGAAITESPAAFLNAIAVPLNLTTDTEGSITLAPGASIKNDGQNNIVLKAIDNKLEIVSERQLNDSRQSLLTVLAENQNKISQSENADVITTKNLRKHMKITNIKDITDESIKEVTASSLVDFVETELKAASEKFAKEKQEKEVVAAELQKKHDELLKNHEQLTKDLETLKLSLHSLEQDKLVRANQVIFDARMSNFEDKYELSADELAVVGSQIKDSNDEQYKKIEANLVVLLKNKSKEVIAEQKKVQEVKASENKEVKTETQVIADALATSQKTSKEIATTSSLQTPTLKERFAKAFSADQFVITK